MAKTEIDGLAKSATIDEALERTHFGKFNYFVIIFSGLVLNNVVLESVGISFALPVLECDLNLTYQQQGILGAVGFIGIIASSHLWGFLADTTGRKRIMHPALILGYLITIVSSFSPNFETLAVLRFLNGVLLSAGSATVFAYLGEFHCHQYRNRAILSSAFISAVSAIFFPIIAWFFINQTWQFYVPFLDITFKPWRSYIIACGTSGLVCGLLLFYLPESPKYLLSVGRADEAIKVLQKIHRQNTNLPNSDFDVTTLLPDFDTPSKDTTIGPSKNALCTLLRSVSHQTAPLFMRQHIRKTLLASLIQFIIFFTAHGVYMWFPYILNSAMQFTQRHSDSTMCLCDIIKFTQSANFSVAAEQSVTCVTHLEISTYQHTIMLELIYVTLLLCVSYAIGKFGRTPILFTVLMICGTCGILGLVIKIPLLAIYFFVVLLCCGIGTTVVNAIVVDIFPTNLRAMAVCISLMLGRIGSVTGSNVMGTLIDSNCEAALFSSAASLIVAGFLGFLLPKPNVQMKKDQDDNI